MKITILGQPVIILSSLKASKDLLEGRGELSEALSAKLNIYATYAGSIYSDRPSAVMAGEL